MKKRLIIFSVFLIAGIALFIGMILQTGLEEIYANLRQFKLFHFGIFLALSTLNFMLYTLRWHLILKAIHKKSFSFWQLFLHRMAGFGISYLTPSAQTGGEPLRILLLHDDGVRTKTATSSVIIDKGLELAALFLFITAGIAAAILDGTLPFGLDLILGTFFVFFFLMTFWFYYSSVKNIGFFSSILRALRLNKLNKIAQLEEKIVEIEEEMARFYKEHLRVFLILILISIVIVSFLLLEHYLIARFMGVHLTFMETFLVSTIPYVAFVIPIPGGLGILEGGHAAIFAALGISINAFVMVFIIRMRDLAFVFVGLIHASKQGVKMLKRAFSENNSG